LKGESQMKNFTSRHHHVHR